MVNPASSLVLTEIPVNGISEILKLNIFVRKHVSSPPF
jgi:hypothetical protein